MQSTISAAGTTIMKFTRNLSRITQSCVLVEAMVVSEINERLSPKNEPPTTMATIYGRSIPVFSANPMATGVRATIVPTLVPMESEMKHAAIKIPASSRCQPDIRIHNPGPYRNHLQSVTSLGKDIKILPAGLVPTIHPFVYLLYLSSYYIFMNKV